jgi:hypothetical protein
MTGRRGRRRKQLLDDLREKRRYWNLEKEALDRTLWRTRFGRGYRPVIRQTTEWMNGPYSTNQSTSAQSTNSPSHVTHLRMRRCWKRTLKGGLLGTTLRVGPFKAHHHYSRFYKVYFWTRSRPGEERLDILSWNIKILSNMKLHCHNLQSKKLKHKGYCQVQEWRVNTVQLNLRNWKHNTLKLL